MSRDYKKKRKRKNQGHQMLTGIFIGLVLGLVLALSITLYFNFGPSPFKQIEKLTGYSKESKTAATNDSISRGNKIEKPELEFFETLADTAISDQNIDEDSQVNSPKKVRVVYFLQVGAFRKKSDADSLRARLALAGIESENQVAELSDGEVWYRVRLGQFYSVEEAEKNKIDLEKMSLKVNLVTEEQ